MEFSGNNTTWPPVCWCQGGEMILLQVVRETPNKEQIVSSGPSVLVGSSAMPNTGLDILSRKFRRRLRRNWFRKGFKEQEDCGSASKIWEFRQEHIRWDISRGERDGGTLVFTQRRENNSPIKESSCNLRD